MALAAVVTGYLSWGAWLSAADQHWLTATHTWWRDWLQPGRIETPLVFVALWLLALLCFWWPRRLAPQGVGLVTVVTMVIVGGVLTFSALTPCRGGQTGGGVAGWVLDLYVGNPPSFPLGRCTTPALAFQVGSPLCLGATLTGALSVAAVVWREPLDRLRARLVWDATVLIGLDTLTLPLLQRLAETQPRNRIVVIEPDGSHPLLAEARATGAKVMVADPAERRVLLPVLAGRGGCALSYLYALYPDVKANEAILETAGNILRTYQPSPERQPHLVARIDDPRHADHWRGRHSGTSSMWFEDALSPLESTASAIARQVSATGAGRMVLCGDSTLALAILLELGRRAWEQRELMHAAASQTSAHPGASWPAEAGQELLTQHSVQDVVLLDRRADDLRREFRTTAPQAAVTAGPDVHAEPVPWQEQLLAMVDGMASAQREETAIVVADSRPGGMHEAGRVARLHPEIPVFVLTPVGLPPAQAIFDQLHTFQEGLMIDGEVPEDVWTRLARHWHECYRLSHPAPANDPQTPAGRRPWDELDEFIKQDNILQLRSVMAATAGRGRLWVPARAVPPGSFIELTRQDLEAVAQAEHARWYERRLAAGWMAVPPPGAGPAGPARVNNKVVPWGELSPPDRTHETDYLCSQLSRLEDVGFMPVIPAGGPAPARFFRRIGVVRARRLHAHQPWTRQTGEQLHGDAGDWRVLDEGGDERTVRDTEFRLSHEPVSGDRWRRIGIFRAWQVGETQVLRTLEGRATADPGDWIVEGHRGERWPVRDSQFRHSYVPCPAPDEDPAR